MSNFEDGEIQRGVSEGYHAPEQVIAILTRESIRESLEGLSWNERKDVLAELAESAGSRTEARLVMEQATELGFLEKYRPGKWQPASGKKGVGAEKIVRAYLNIPATRAERQEYTMRNEGTDSGKKRMPFSQDLREDGRI